MEYVTPYVHAMAFYGMYQDDIRHLANYEASFNYFPINHFHSQSYAGQEDYVIAWMYPAEEKFADLKPNYQLIYQSKSKNLKLFRRQQATVVDRSGWRRENGKQLTIHFDFQPTGGETAEDHHMPLVRTQTMSAVNLAGLYVRPTNTTSRQQKDRATGPRFRLGYG